MKINSEWCRSSHMYEFGTPHTLTQSQFMDQFIFENLIDNN